MPQSHSLIPRHSVDHIVPVCQGGRTEFKNAALACQGCNNYKSSQTKSPDPLTDAPVRLFHPRKDRWGDHFAWSQDFLRIEGLTAIGRATVAVMEPNREGLINLRRALILDGAHPPPVDE